MKILRQFLLYFSVTFLFTSPLHSNPEELVNALENSIVEQDWKLFNATVKKTEQILNYRHKIYNKYMLLTIRGYLNQRIYKKASARIKIITEYLFNRHFETNDELYEKLTSTENQSNTQQNKIHVHHSIMLLLAEYYAYTNELEKAKHLTTLLNSYAPYLQNETRRLLGKIKMEELLYILENSIFESDWETFNETAEEIGKILDQYNEVYYRYMFLAIRGCLAQRIYKKAYIHIKLTAECLFGKHFETEDELFIKLSNNIDLSITKRERISEWHSIMLLLAEYYVYIDEFEKAECLLMLLYKYTPHLHGSICLLLGDIKLIEKNEDDARRYYSKAYDAAKESNDPHYIIGLIYVGLVKCDLVESDRDLSLTRKRIKRAKHHFDKDRYKFGQTLIEFYNLELDFKLQKTQALMSKIEEVEEKFLDMGDLFYWGLSFLFKKRFIKTQIRYIADTAVQERIQGQLDIILTPSDDENIPLLKRLLEELNLLPSPRDDDDEGEEATSKRSSFVDALSPRLGISPKRRGSNSDLEKADSAGSVTSSLPPTPRGSAPNSPRLSRASSSQNNLRGSPLRKIPGTRVHALANSGEI